MVVNLTRKEAVSRFSKVRWDYWLITLINVGSWRDACCRVAESFSNAAPRSCQCVCVCVCDISAPNGKSVRQASCCVAELEGWLRGSVAAKRHVSLLQ